MWPFVAWFYFRIWTFCLLERRRPWFDQSIYAGFWIADSREETLCCDIWIPSESAVGLLLYLIGGLNWRLDDVAMWILFKNFTNFNQPASQPIKTARTRIVAWLIWRKSQEFFISLLAKIFWNQRDSTTGKQQVYSLSTKLIEQQVLPLLASLLNYIHYLTNWTKLHSRLPLKHRCLLAQLLDV